MKSIGVLYPGNGAEADYAWANAHLQGTAAILIEHTAVPLDSHSPAAVRAVGDTALLRDGLRRLMSRLDRLDAVVWACTSGSFVLGRAGAEAQVAALESESRAPATSTSLAFIAALRALDADRVAVAATYPRKTADLFAAFLAEFGISVVKLVSANIQTGRAATDTPFDRVASLVAKAASADADIVLIPDTALFTLQHLDAIGSQSTPTLTANQVSLYHAALLAGLDAVAAEVLSGRFPPAHSGRHAPMEALSGPTPTTSPDYHPNKREVTSG